MNQQKSEKEQLTYDAIVIGSGISGGWAAKELCEKGLKTLVLERGNPIRHVEDYKSALKDPWEMPHRGQLTVDLKEKFPIQTKEGNYPISEYNQDFWLPETESPYIQKSPFDWFRGGGTGGKSLTWGRQVYRWSDTSFEANAKEGIAIDWPIRYKDIAPWYSYVERFVGVSGEKLNLPHLPDSEFQPPMQFNCVEEAAKSKIKSKYGDSRLMTIGRVAHITEPTAEQLALGRASCQYRNKCSNGCPYGAYFSSQAATLPAAEHTGNLTLRTNAVVSRIIYDEQTKKASGVEIIDTETMEAIQFSAKIIFVNASTIATAQILLNSTSDRFPNGLGNNSNQLGRNLMDHHSRVGASGQIEGFEDKTYYGQRANGIFIPRYQNIGSDKRSYLRGFDYQGGAGRSRGSDSDESFGAEFKKSQTEFGSWGFGLSSFGETLPYEDNRITLHQSQKDRYGIPLAVIDAKFRENEYKMRVDMEQDAIEFLEVMGAKNIQSYRLENPPLGLSKHEMGTARMGRDPKTSVLNGNNQLWDCKNVFVTDGACMTSSNCVNPSLTYMALTARAVDFAVNELKRMNL